VNGKDLQALIPQKGDRFLSQTRMVDDRFTAVHIKKEVGFDNEAELSLLTLVDWDLHIFRESFACQFQDQLTEFGPFWFAASTSTPLKREFGGSEDGYSMTLR